VDGLSAVRPPPDGARPPAPPPAGTHRRRARHLPRSAGGTAPGAPGPGSVDGRGGARRRRTVERPGHPLGIDVDEARPGVVGRRRALGPATTTRSRRRTVDHAGRQFAETGGRGSGEGPAAIDRHTRRTPPADPSSSRSAAGRPGVEQVEQRRAGTGRQRDRRQSGHRRSSGAATRRRAAPTARRRPAVRCAARRCGRPPGSRSPGQRRAGPVRRSQLPSGRATSTSAAPGRASMEEVQARRVPAPARRPQPCWSVQRSSPAAAHRRAGRGWPTPSPARR